MRYDIEILNPFGMLISINDCEDHLPSIGVSIKFEFDLYGGRFSYLASDSWFECSVIDNFASNLKKIKNGANTTAELFDIDREIMLTFARSGISLSINRVTPGVGSGKLKLKHEYDHAIICQHIERLNKFSKWW